MDGMTNGMRITWTKSTNCDNVAGAGTAVKSEDYYAGTLNPVFALLDTATAGVYNLCAQPDGGIYTHIPQGSKLSLITHPTFTPIVSYAGTQSRVQFAGPWAVGDKVAMTNTDCSSPHLIATTIMSLSLQSLDELGRMYTNATMTKGIKLTLCYATQESGADSSDDFASLASFFYQIRFTPFRTIIGARQTVTLEGMREGDHIGWTNEAECGAFGTVATQAKTVSYRVNSTGTAVLHNNPLPAPGVWYFCYRVAGAEDFARISYGYLYFIPEPVYSPTSMLTDVPVTIVFSSGSTVPLLRPQVGDLMVMRSKSRYANCTGAHLLSGDSAYQMQKRAISGDLSVLTPTVMQYAGEYFVCYATVESGGDDDVDYHQLTTPFFSRFSIRFTPNKTVEGTVQVIDIFGAQEGDQVAWTSRSSCAGAGNADGYRTWTFYLSLGTNEVTFHIGALPGVWTLCFQPSGGFSTQIPTKTITIIPRPAFLTNIGVAGSLTHIVFGGNVSAGDYVTMQPGSCLNAHLARVGPLSNGGETGRLFRNYLGETVSSTQIPMTSATGLGEELKVCYATKETGGDSADDYVILSGTFMQVRGVLFETFRIVSGAAQKLRVTGGSPGYQLAWARATRCTNATADGPESKDKTLTYNLTTEEPVDIVFHRDTNPGLWVLCYRPTNPVDGVWTKIHNKTLEIIAQPIFTPFEGVATLVTPIAFSSPATDATALYWQRNGTIVDGDFIVFQPNNCSNPQDSLAGPSILPKTPLLNSKVYTRTTMDGVGPLRICFATIESGADSNDDWAELAYSDFLQVKAANFTPQITLSGAPTVMHLLHGKPGDVAAWTLDGECDNLNTGNATVNQSVIYDMTSADTAVTLHKLTSPGVYKFCFKAARGIWMHVHHYYLTILARPSFLPLVGFTGIATPLVFNPTVTAKDGDFVVLHNMTCDNAHTRVTSASSLAATALSGLQVSTLPQMTYPNPLYVCYALAASGGDSHDDFATIDTKFVNIYFWPQRTMTGSEQRITVYGARSGDRIVFTQGTNCDGASGVALTNKTGEFLVSSVEDVFIFHKEALPGIYSLCHKAPGHAVWAMVSATGALQSGYTLTVVERPTLTPLFGFAGLSSNITFAGTAQDGDFIVFTTAAVKSCTYAHEVALGPSSMGKTILGQQFPLGITLPVEMYLSEDFTVCYATHESGGDSIGDYSTLNQQYMTFGFEPRRTVEGATQRLALEGGLVGDKVIFLHVGGGAGGITGVSDCTAVSSLDPSSSTQSAVYTITQDPEVVTLHNATRGGRWAMCYHKASYGPVSGFFKVQGVYLNIISQPFTIPDAGVAGHVTPITIIPTVDGVTGDLLSGDFLVMQENNCINAHLAVNGVASKAPTGMTTIPGKRGTISTIEAMTKDTTLRVCFATFETSGDSADDYVMLNTTITQRQPPVLNPNRFALFTPQKMWITENGGGMIGGTLFFTQYEWCNQSGTSGTQTQQYTMTAETQLIQISNALSIGHYTMCYMPYNEHSEGLWTKINAPNTTFAVIPRPTYFPAVGIAGSVTKLDFAGAVDGDTIVMQIENCNNAHLAVVALQSLQPTKLSKYGTEFLTLSTLTNMSAVGTMKLCYASKESLGDTPDDYVELASPFVQRISPDWTPKRTVSGAPQLLRFINGLEGDALSLTHGDCIGTYANPAGLTLPVVNETTTAERTRVYLFGSSFISTVPQSQDFSLHTTALHGTFQLCYKPVGGRWTHVQSRVLGVMARPTFTPPVAVAGGITALNYSGTHNHLRNTITGDFVTLQETGCLNSHSVTTGLASRERQTILAGEIAARNYSTQTSTVVAMANATTLHVCYATYESQGDEADDFTSIGTLRQITPADFNPKRTLTGTAQLFNVTLVKADDKVAWTQDPECIYYDNHSAPATLTQTLEYLVTGFHQEMGLHTSAVPGIWNLCERLGNGGVWTRVTGVFATIAAQPSFLPRVGLSAAQTPLNFTGTFNTLQRDSDGDFVVLQPNHCLNAHATALGVDTLPRTAIKDRQILTSLAMTRPQGHQEEAVLKICYATEESAGDSADDYVELAGLSLTQYSPPAFRPVRTVYKAAQKLNLTNAHLGDQVAWIKGKDCNAHQIPNVFSVNNSGTANQSQIYTLTAVGNETCSMTQYSDGVNIPNTLAAGEMYRQVGAATTVEACYQACCVESRCKGFTVPAGGGDCYLKSGDCSTHTCSVPGSELAQVSYRMFRAPVTTGEYQQFTLHTAMLPGDYKLCHRLKGYQGYEGVWTTVTNRRLEIIPQITFTPMVGLAGSVTPISFVGALHGDYIAIQPATKGCSNSHLVLEGPNSLPSTVVGPSHFGINQVLTTVNMTSPKDLVLCFATIESGGDSPDDFTVLEYSSFLQLAAPTFDPKRIVRGAHQHVDLFGSLNRGDRVVWSTHTTCLTAEGPASPNKTGEYVFNSTNQTFTLHPLMDPGTWTMCYKLAGGNPRRPTYEGLWTTVTDREFVIIPRPTFFPLEGIAGSVLQVHFTGTAISGPLEDDWVTFQHGTCENAHNQTTTGTSLEPTRIGNASVFTHSTMNVSTTLMICFATREAKGDTSDDYVALDSIFEQLEPINFEPKRFVAGTQQELNITGGNKTFNAGDSIVFVLSDEYPYCFNDGRTDAAATSKKSRVITFTDEPTYSRGWIQVTHYVRHIGPNEYYRVGRRTQIIQPFIAPDAPQPDPGPWKLCFKPKGYHWSWIRNTVPDARVLQVVTLPVFGPTRFLAGSVSRIKFVMPAAAYGIVKDGDIVVLQDQNCNNAHLTQLTGKSLNAQAIKTAHCVNDGGVRRRRQSSHLHGGCSGSEATDEGDQQILTNVAMTEATFFLKVCFASKESLGDTADDFYMLPVQAENVLPPDFSPNRTIQGAKQILVLTNSFPDDEVAWTLGDCYTDIKSATQFSTQGARNNRTTLNYIRSASYFGNQPQPFVLHRDPLPEPGYWKMCFKLRNGGQWLPVTNKTLDIMLRPTFGPPVGVAGHNTKIDFNGSRDGDYFVLMPDVPTVPGVSDDCSNAHLVLTGLNTLGKCLGVICLTKKNIHYTYIAAYDTWADYSQTERPSIKNSALLTEMANRSPGSLKVCYATYESEGNSADDYSTLDGYFVQVRTPDWTPKRTVTGAMQTLRLEGAVFGDLITWTTAASCTNRSLATDRQTAIYTVPTSNLGLFGLNGLQMVSGWVLCYQPRCLGRSCMSQEGGLWTHITYAVGEPSNVASKILTVINKPFYTPLVGLAGSVTPLKFSGDSQDGDYIVLQETNCDNANASITGRGALTPITIFAGLIRTVVAMKKPTTLVVCYATTESVASDGNSADDYAILPNPFVQRMPPSIDPDRIFTGAAQQIIIQGTTIGDTVAWTSTPDCTFGHTEDGPTTENLPYQLESPSSPDKTVAYDLFTGGRSTITIHMALDPPTFSDLSPNVYTMCYAPFQGVWTRIIPWTEQTGGISRNLRLVERPTFLPVQGIAGSATKIVFTGDVIDNDMVVMNLNTCFGAQSVKTGVRALARTAIVNKIMYTSAKMVKGASLSVCMATRESRANSNDDYTTLAITFTQVAPPDFEPFRTFQGASQILDVSVPTIGDEVVWIYAPDGQFPECTAFSVQGAATPEKTALTKMAVYNGEVPLHTTARAGTWHLCHRLEIGVWTRVEKTNVGRPAVLTIVAQPTFHPAVGIAGAYTPIAFQVLTTGLPQFTEGDYVVLQESNCENSHLAAMGVSTLPPTSINGNNVVFTSANMTKQTTLKTCVATKETRANSADDFVMLVKEFVQVAPAPFTPDRTITGAPQLLTVSPNTALHNPVDDEVVWTRYPTCDPATITQGVSADRTVHFKLSVASANKRVVQLVTYAHIHADDWNGASKIVYEIGYGIGIGIYDLSASPKAFKKGCSLTSTFSGKNGITVTYTAVVPPLFSTLTSNLAGSMTAVSLIATTTTASTTIYPGNTFYQEAEVAKIGVVAPQIAPAVWVLPLHTTARAGFWNTCYKLSGGGLWTRVNVGDSGLAGNAIRFRLNVIAKPYLYPTTGIAGSETPIQFSAGISEATPTGEVGADNSVVHGDLVVLQEGDCNNAHLATTVNATMAASVLSESAWGPLRMVTKKNATALATLVVCYASKESLGNSADDYTQVSFEELNVATRRPAVHSSEGSRRWDMYNHVATAHQSLPAGSALAPTEKQVVVQDLTFDHRIAHTLVMHNTTIVGFTGEWTGNYKRVYEIAYAMAVNLYLIGSPFKAECNVTSALVQNRPWHGTLAVEFMITVPESLRAVTQSLVDGWRFINAFDQVVWDVEPLLGWIRAAFDSIGVMISIPQTYQLTFHPARHYSRTVQRITFKNLNSWTPQMKAAYRAAYAKTIGIYNTTNQSVVTDYIDYAGTDQTLVPTRVDPASPFTVEFVSMVTVAHKDQVRQIVNTANRAVDGTAHVSFALNGCSMTQWQANPWLRVDLQQAIYVRRVVLRNRDDALFAQLADFEVRVGQLIDVVQNQKCGDRHTAAAGASLAVQCGDLFGQYVSVNLHGDYRMLSLCEVAVYGVAQPGLFTQRALSVFKPSRTVAGAAQNLKTMGPATGDQVAWTRIASAECRTEYYTPHTAASRIRLGPVPAFQLLSLTNGDFENSGGHWEKILQFPSSYTPTANAAGSLNQPILRDLTTAKTTLGTTIAIPSNADVAVGSPVLTNKLIWSISYQTLSGPMWIGDVKTGHEAAIAIALGIYDNDRKSTKPGVTLETSGVGIFGLTLTITITVPDEYVSATKALSQSGTPSQYVASIIIAKALLALDIPVPAASDISLFQPQWTIEIYQASTMSTMWSSDWSPDAKRTWELAYAMSTEVYVASAYKAGCHVTSSMTGFAGITVNFTAVFNTTSDVAAGSLVVATGIQSSLPQYDFYKMADVDINAIVPDGNGFYYYKYTSRTTLAKPSLLRHHILIRTTSPYTDTIRGFGFGVITICTLATKADCDANSGWASVNGNAFSNGIVHGTGCLKWSSDESAPIECAATSSTTTRCFTVGGCPQNSGGPPREDVVVYKLRAGVDLSQRIPSWGSFNSRVVTNGDTAATALSTSAATGLRYAAINSTAGAGQFSQGITNAIPGYSYRLSWNQKAHRTLANGVEPRLSVFIDGTTVLGHASIDYNQWEARGLVFIANASSLTLTFASDLADGYVLVDDVAVKESLTALETVPGHTPSYLMFDATQNNVLHTTASAGFWSFCQQPYGGVWTLIQSQRLEIIETPTFFPHVGIAGSITPLQFSGGVLPAIRGGNGIVLESNPVLDIVVLQALNCTNAHLTTRTGSSLEPTALKDQWVSNFGQQYAAVTTNYNMTTTQTLKVCFATAESQLAGANGGSNDDFVELATVFRNRRPTDFRPKSVIVEDNHFLVMTGGEAGDELFFTQGHNCSHYNAFIARTPIPTMATMTLTDTYVLSTAIEVINVPVNVSIGKFRYCYKPFGGVAILVQTTPTWSSKIEPNRPVMFEVLPRPSDDTLTFDIIKAPRIICYRDLFSATVAVTLVPEGLPSAFDHWVASWNGTKIFSPPMAVSTSNFDYKTPTRLPLGAFSFNVFGIDPLFRAKEFDILKTHYFNVTESPVVPITFQRINIPTYRDQVTVVNAWVPVSECVTSNVTIVYYWKFMDDQTGLDLLDSLPVMRTTPQLVIPAYTLIPGQSYTVFVSGYYDIPGIMTASKVEISTFVRVQYNPIVPYFKQGYEMKIGSMQTFDIETMTHDPDGTLGNRHLSYKWQMTPWPPSLTAILNGAGRVLTIPEFRLAENATYLVNCTVSKPNTTSVVTAIILQVGYKRVPLITIATGDIGYSNGYLSKVDITKTLTMLGKVEGEHNSTYEWSMQGAAFKEQQSTIQDNTVVESKHAANLSLADLSIKPNSMKREAKYGFRLASGNFDSRNQSEVGFSTFQIKTSGAPHSGSFVVQGTDAGVVAMTTEVSMSASSWKDAAEDFPLYFQFGYYFYARPSESQVSASNPTDVIFSRPAHHATTTKQFFIIQPYSEVNSVTTQALPPGKIVPIVWVKDRYGAERVAYYGCNVNKEKGEWATDFECGSLRTIIVADMPINREEGGVFPRTQPEAITGFLKWWNYKNYDVVVKLAFMQALVGVVNGIPTESRLCDKTWRPYECCNTACINEAKAMRTFLTDMINATVRTGEAVSPDQFLGTVALIAGRTSHLMANDGEIMRSVDDMFDTALATATVRGIQIATGVKNAVEILTLLAVTQNNSAFDAAPAIRALSSYTAALKLRHQVTVVTEVAIRDFIVNSPVVTVNSSNTTTGTMLIELALYRSTAAAMHGGTVETGSMKLFTPRASMFDEPTLFGDNVRDRARQFISCTFASWYANPYAYDTYRVLKSGITMLRFNKLDKPTLVLANLPAEKRPVLGLKLTFVSGAPKCFYREAWKSFDGFSDSGIETSRFRHAIGSNVSEPVFCETSHNGLTDDFVISDGCYQHRQYTMAKTCSSHGFCNLDSTCHCVCGYFSSNCTKIHVAKMKTRSKNRFFSGAALTVQTEYNATGGRIALVRQQKSGVWSCEGAGSTPINSFAAAFQRKIVKWGIEIQEELPQTAGSKLPVLNASIVLPHIPNTPVAPGLYTLCFCNAEKVNDPVYANCNMDCAYMHRNDTITIINEPRLGSPTDSGSGRAIGGAPTTFRLTAGPLMTTKLVNGDMLFLAASCGDRIPGFTNSSTGVLTMNDLETRYFSNFFTLPPTLFNLPGNFTVLKLCFATREMGLNPRADEFAMLTDTLVIISKPLLAGGVNLRAVSASSPDFNVIGSPGMGAWGVMGGDLVYFKERCVGGPTARLARIWETLPISLEMNNDPILGPACDLTTGVAFPVLFAASSVRAKFPNQAAVESWCGDESNAILHSPSAWCASGTLAADTILSEFVQDSIGRPILDQRQWIELDAGDAIMLAGVQTQGRRDMDEWVRSYSIKISTDGHTFETYTENAKKVVFNANQDRNTVVTGGLKTGIRARKVRIYPEAYYKKISLRAGLLGCLDIVKLKLPTNPALTTPTQTEGDPLRTDFGGDTVALYGGSDIRYLKACFATRRSEGDSALDFVTLDQELHMIPEATDPIMPLEYPRGLMTKIEWLLTGDSMMGHDGDVFVLSRGMECNGVRASPLPSRFGGPDGPSGLITLKVGATVGRDVVMKAKLNELNSGNYRVCYATKESLGDSDADFNSLRTTVDIFIDQRAPELHVPPSVSLGHDLVVKWVANNDLTKRVRAGKDWLGLYRKGDCTQMDYYHDRAKTSGTNTEAYMLNVHSQNQCYLASAPLGQGEVEGEVRFTASQYQHESGQYEVRYFGGDSISGAGYVCRGLQGVAEGEHKICALESMVTSGAVVVEPSFSEGSYQHMSAQDHVPQAMEQKIPGLETFCVGPECGEV